MKDMVAEIGQGMRKSPKSHRKPGDRDEQGEGQQSSSLLQRASLILLMCPVSLPSHLNH